MSSKLIVNTPERRHGRPTDVFIVNFEHILHIFYLFILFSRANK